MVTGIWIQLLVSLGDQMFSPENLSDREIDSSFGKDRFQPLREVEGEVLNAGFFL